MHPVFPTCVSIPTRSDQQTCSHLCTFLIEHPVLSDKTVGDRLIIPSPHPSLEISHCLHIRAPPSVLTLDKRAAVLHAVPNSKQYLEDSLGGDGRPRLVLLVLPRIRVARDHGSDAFCGRGFARCLCELWLSLVHCAIERD